MSRNSVHKFFKKLGNQSNTILADPDSSDFSKLWADDDDSQRSQRSRAYDAAFDNAPMPTRWERSIVGLNGIVKQVSKVDPDGLGKKNETSTTSVDQTRLDQTRQLLDEGISK